MVHSQFWEPTTDVRACQQRLKKLHDAQLINKKPQTIIDGGREPDLCFLLPTGAELIADYTGVYPKRVTHSKTDTKPFTLRHRVAMIEARLAFDAATELVGWPRPDWIMEQDTNKAIPRLRNVSPSDYLILRNVYQDGRHTTTFRPDAACRLQVPKHKKDGYASLLVYFELDRSTESHSRFAKKLPGMESFFNDVDGSLKHWPELGRQPRVVFVLCPSQQRIKGLSDAVRDSPQATKIRFTTFPLNPAHLLTDKIWQDTQGDRFSIIRSD